MKNMRFIEQICSMIFILSVFPLAAQNRMLANISTSGGTAASANYAMTALIGQSSPIGIATGGQYCILSGSLYAFNTNEFSYSTALFSLSPGNKDKNYRLISVPALLEDPDPGKVLIDDLGSYEKTEWRLFDCTNGKKIDSEYPKTRDFMPGVALCIITKSKKTIDIEKGSLIEAPTFSIPLRKGWNLIGNPYNFSMPVENLYLSTDPQAKVIFWEYTGGWKKATELSPWHGYAVNVSTAAALVVSSTIPAASIKKASMPDLAENEWQIQISAKSGDLQDEENFAGIRRTAQFEDDVFDEFEPPSFGDYISLSFPHPEWKTYLTDLASDIKPSAGDGWIWNMKLQSNLSNRVLITFTGLEKVPDTYNIFFLDPAARIVTNIRTINHLEVGAISSLEGRVFQLIVGNTAFTNEQISSYQSLPTQYALQQNFPNPFNPSTSIVFDLPRANHVTLVIKNILGQEVAALARDQLYDAGRHVIIWDARNSSGYHSGSGTYFYEIRTEGWSEIRKMLFMQ